MRDKLNELDVDFIGGQDKPLTKEEELKISNFIKALKEKRLKATKRKTTKPKKETI